MNTKRIIINVVVALVLCILLVLMLWRAGPERTPEPLTAEISVSHPPQAVSPEAVDPTTPPNEGFDLDAHIERVSQWDPETGFDQAAHVAALEQVGGVHHARIAESAQAAGAVQAYETEHRRATPERAALAESIDELITTRDAFQDARRSVLEADDEWQALQRQAAEADQELAEKRRQVQVKLQNLESDPTGDAEDTPAAETVRAAIQTEMQQMREAAEEARRHRAAVETREAELTEEHETVREAVAGIGDTQAQIAEKEAELRETFTDDEGWQALQTEAEAAEERQDHARNRLQAVIRARMVAEHEMAQAAKANDEPDPDATP